MTGRRQLRAELESTWKRLRGAWKRRDGSTAKACEKDPGPLGPHMFTPTLLHPMNDEERAAVRKERNQRKARDRKRR